MRTDSQTETGLTLIELLVVISILAVLAALVLSVLSTAKKKARQTICMNHLRQINLGVRMYSDDAGDALPTPGATATATNRTLLYSGYKALMKSYIGLNGASSLRDRLFSCPADVFYPSFFQTNTSPAYNVRQSLHQLPLLDFSSSSYRGIRWAWCGDRIYIVDGRDFIQGILDSHRIGWRFGSCALGNGGLLAVSRAREQ